MTDPKMTPEQLQALRRAYDRTTGVNYVVFMASVQGTFGMDGAVVVPWCGMFLAIEKDGYTHS